MAKSILSPFLDYLNCAALNDVAYDKQQIDSKHVSVGAAQCQDIKDTYKHQHKLPEDHEFRITNKGILKNHSTSSILKTSKMNDISSIKKRVKLMQKKPSNTHTRSFSSRFSPPSTIHEDETSEETLSGRNSFTSYTFVSLLDTESEENDYTDTAESRCPVATMEPYDTIEARDDISCYLSSGIERDA